MKNLERDVLSLIYQIFSWSYVSETVTLHQNTSMVITGKG